jgi:hypothetical protein
MIYYRMYGTWHGCAEGPCAVCQISMYGIYMVYGTWNVKHRYGIQVFLVCMLDAGK